MKSPVGLVLVLALLILLRGCDNAYRSADTNKAPASAAGSVSSQTVAQRPDVAAPRATRTASEAGVAQDANYQHDSHSEADVSAAAAEASDT